MTTVQYLRAIAALMVTYYHTLDQIPSYEPYFRKYLLGWESLASGVDIFFVISGFIMLVTSRNSTPGEFMLRRIIRVVPLYWILTTLLAVVVLWHPEFFRTTIFTASYYLESLFFIPFANPGHGWEVAPLLVPGWSLNLEMLFYCIFALALFAAKGRRLLLTGIVLFGLVIAARVFRNAYEYRQWLFLGDFRVLEFWMGMCVGELFLRGKLRISAGVSATILGCGFVAIFWRLDFLGLTRGDLLQNIITNALPATLIVFGAVALEQSRKVPAIRPLLFLGNASYSLYLSHLFFLGAARVVWLRLGLGHDGFFFAAGFLIFCALLVVAGTALIYRFVERPLLNSFQNLALRVTPLHTPREAGIGR